METKDILRALIRDRFGNNQASFARAIKRSPSQVNQWLIGYLRLDVKASRHIERELNLPIDYFLTSQSDNEFASALQARETSVPYLNREYSAEVMEISNIAHSLDDVGKGMLLQSARLIAKERESLRKEKHCIIIDMKLWRQRMLSTHNNLFGD